MPTEGSVEQDTGEHVSRQKAHEENTKDGAAQTAPRDQLQHAAQQPQHRDQHQMPRPRHARTHPQHLVEHQPKHQHTKHKHLCNRCAGGCEESLRNKRFSLLIRHNNVVRYDFASFPAFFGASDVIPSFLSIH